MAIESLKAAELAAHGLEIEAINDQDVTLIR